MALESATYISELVDTNPTVSDPVGQGDDHLKMIKTVLKTQFSGLAGTTAITTDEAEMNLLDGGYEGTAVVSTGETGATKFLREDGDNTSSWQVPTDTNTTYTAGDGLDLSGTTFSTDLKSNGGLEIDSTELSVAQGISQYDVAQFSTGVADNDFLKIDGTAVEGRSATELLSDVSSIDNSWSGSQRGTPSTVTDGTLDLDTANNFLYTPGAADVLEFSNETTGQSGFIKLINPSGYTISLGSEVKAVSTFATDVTVAGTYLVTYFSDPTNVYVSASAILV